MSIEMKELQDIKGRLTELERARAKREASLEAATERLREVLTTLTQEFDVKTLDDAKNLMKRMEDEVAEELEAIREKLAETAD